MFGRILKSSIAKDNGRTEEFATQKKTFEDKSRCFECGQEGHLSYQCPSNALGSREPPKRGSRKHEKEGSESGDQDDSLGAAIRYEQQKRSMQEQSTSLSATNVRKKKFKPSSYFSDEEEISDWSR